MSFFKDVDWFWLAIAVMVIASITWSGLAHKSDNEVKIKEIEYKIKLPEVQTLADFNKVTDPTTEKKE